MADREKKRGGWKYKNLNISRKIWIFHSFWKAIIWWKKKKKKAGKSFNKYSIDYFVNPFHAIGLFLYPLKTLPYHEILPLLITKTSLAPPLIYCGHNFLVQINEKHNIVLITENLIVLLLFPCTSFSCHWVIGQTIPGLPQKDSGSCQIA